MTSRLRVAAAVVWRGDAILLTQRPPGDPLGLLWEFPGGKIEDGETPQQALVRELHEELGVAARVGEVVGTSHHTYHHGLQVEIVFVTCTLSSFAFRPSHAVHGVRWARPEEVDLEEVLEADRAFLKGLEPNA